MKEDEVLTLLILLLLAAKSVGWRHCLPRGCTSISPAVGWELPVFVMVCMTGLETEAQGIHCKNCFNLKLGANFSWEWQWVLVLEIWRSHDTCLSFSGAKCRQSYAFEHEHLPSSFTILTRVFALTQTVSPRGSWDVKSRHWWCLTGTVNSVRHQPRHLWVCSPEFFTKSMVEEMIHICILKKRKWLSKSTLSTLLTHHLCKSADYKRNKNGTKDEARNLASKGRWFDVALFHVRCKWTLLSKCGPKRL